MVSFRSLLSPFEWAVYVDTVFPMSSVDSRMIDRCRVPFVARRLPNR